jgi:leucyl aminopeptidase
VRAARGSGPLASALGIDVGAVAAKERASTGAGDLTRVPYGSAAGGSTGQVFLVGVGDGSPAALRSAAAVVARSVRGVDLVVTSLAAGSAAEGVAAVAEGVLLGAYRVARTGKKADEPSTAPARVQLTGVNATDAVRRGLAAARATLLARELANTRSSTKSPAWLVGRARQVARSGDLDMKVWDQADLRRDGFAAILAVGEGAEHGPRLVQLEHRPPGRSRAGRPHVVLVGKGITFDTGGISLKPREAMLGMTTDMTGSAVVLAVLGACRELGVEARVTGLMPLAENALGAGSYRPGDVVRTYDGTTVEVRNTDAEGRMVLADAMGYARTRLRPDVMVDIATLTGAATQGLGRGYGALYANDERLAGALTRAGEGSGERLWRMPLVEDYREWIDSDVADVCQISTKRENGAGSVMAALFLREFAGDVPWAHLDIAGTGRSERDRAEVNRGGTGFGARLLLRWLLSL